MQPVTAAVDDGVVIADSQRQPDAFRAVFDRHYDRVRRYAWARIGAAGEDVAAEVFALADLSYADIAQALGIAEGTVRSRLHRARRILKEVISR
jgi:DNA-directed RNA polymerase specialized sigma24 family protein